MDSDKRPNLATDAVLKSSDPVPEGAIHVGGIDFNKMPNPSAVDLVKAMKLMGFQATSVGQACDIINKMRHWRGATKQAQAEYEEELTKYNQDNTNSNQQQPPVQPQGNEKCTIFLGYTSNLISSGLRSTLKFLVEHKLVSALVTTAGGIEEDLIKCLADTYLGDFTLSGSGLRDKGMNRIGNLLVPNDNYCKFEKWIVPILDQMLNEQEKDGISWSPSTVIDRLGKEINNKDSVLYWAHKNQIPIFCPALTDGSLGDMLFFHTFKASPLQLKIDIVADIRKINSLSMAAPAAGMIILGGGLVKHHIANACLMRNGADFAVYINTGQEFDGSDAGARPDEAVSWGKIKQDAKSVKVHADATVVFPLIVGATFASGDDPSIYDH